MPGAGNHKIPLDTPDLQGLLIWADPAVLVVNKPAGLPSLPDGYDIRAPFLKGVLETQFGRLWTVHRLDRGTSGVSVLARSAAAHRNLNTQFETHQVKKIYHAIVVGLPPWESFEARMPLRAGAGRRHRTVVDETRGKAAHTSFQVLERWSAYALVAAQPHTGRTHQIRVHLFTLGFPVLADGLYGEPAEMGRTALHAQLLGFNHPEHGDWLEFSAPYPLDFTTALARLRAAPVA